MSTAVRLRGPTSPNRICIHVITSFRTRRSTLSGGQHAAWERLWPEMGMHARDADGTRAAAGHRILVRPVSAGGAGDRQAARESRHWRWRRPSRTWMWSRWRYTGAGWHSSSARSAREDVTNIRLVRGDGIDVLEHMFGPDSLTGSARLLPRPVAEGPAPQAQAAAACDRRADRRPAAARRSPSCRDRSRRVRRADRRSRRRRTATAPSHGIGHASDLGAAARHEVTKARPSTRAAPLPSCSGRNDHEPH